MKIGIDMGGTHTDGILLENNQVINTAKITTEPTDLTQTILDNCRLLIEDYAPENIEQVTLSTTLATNVIAQGDYPPVGLILIPGPGINPQLHNYDFPYQTVSGYIDHRGRETKPLNHQEIRQAVSKLVESGVKQIGICGKFATRNSKQEQAIKELINEQFSAIKQVTVSHQLTGELNFPRRVVTTYLNCIIEPTHQQFVSAIKQGLNNLDITASLYLSKADGGTIPLNKSTAQPIAASNSGPAASIMGIMAANPPKETTLGLDIGGTTTDISLFVNQAPLFKPDGIQINQYKTLIRGLYNVSIPCGGDSLVQITDKELKIGPVRKDAAAAFGGDYPTPTDALVVKDKLSEGNQQAAQAALKPLAEQLNLSVNDTAEQIIARFCKKIKQKLTDILTNLNQQPVYTINQLLDNNQLEPQQLIGIGGPARALIPRLAETLNLAYKLPQQAEVANALGAALSRVTNRCTLYADTAEGYYNIPELDIQQKIQGRFDLQTARKTVRNALKSSLAHSTNIEITNQQSFNIVRRFQTLGKIIKITAQVKPGLIS